MAHISIDTIRAKLAGVKNEEQAPSQSAEESLTQGELNGGTDEQAPSQSAEESLTQGELNGGTDEQAPSQSAEESLQPVGGDAGAVSRESNGSDGADGEQTDSADDAAGSSPDKTQAKPKNRAK